ncbi:MAG: glycosyltransferase family 4 protein [Terracidiphilus sp.]
MSEFDAAPGEAPRKVLITGGHEVGGVGSFAEALMEGFLELNISAEIISPGAVPSRWREVRDPSVLLILSTSAIFAAPFAARSLCVAHGFPGAGQIGRIRFFGHLCADKLASSCRNAQLVTVSEYAAAHFRTVFDLPAHVIRNPVKRIFQESPEDRTSQRTWITYAGRLAPVKNIPLFLPAVMDLLNAHPELNACVIGVGPERKRIEQVAANHPRVELTGAISDHALRDRLRKTAVFISANETEQFGISYLEALSQGCSVVMPACGGGLEIAPHLIGSQVQLAPLPLERDTLYSSLCRALASSRAPIEIAPYSPKAVAAAYLRLDLSRRISRKHAVPTPGKRGSPTEA